MNHDLVAPPPDLRSTLERDQWFMALALAEARQAAEQGEVPVGAVAVQGGQVIARSHNAPIAANDPTAHAEILLLRQAGQLLGNYRLPELEIYVSLEPCAMCAGALLWARVARVVYAAVDAKTGAAGGCINLFAHPKLNHHTTVIGGIEHEASVALLQAFFSARR